MAIPAKCAWVLVTVVGVFAACAESPTGESPDPRSDAGMGGSGGDAGSNASAGVNGAGRGGRAGSAGKGGSASGVAGGAGISDGGIGAVSGSAGEGESGRGQAGGGDAGESARGGAGGSDGAGASGAAGSGPGGAPAADWDAACGDVTPNGHCIGEVYEWCDFFTRSLKTLDCAELDMRCVAAALQPQEADLNGCVGDPCDGVEDHCEGRLAHQCRADGMHVLDCAQRGGPDGVCMLTEAGYARCQSREPCSPQSSFRCEGKLNVTCDEDGYLHFQDCARCNPAGVCVASGGGQTNCDPPYLSCGED